MMGLLDALNSRDGVFALGLLDAASPRAQRTGIGAGLLSALSQAQAFQSAQEDREQRRRMQELQMQAMQQQASQQAWQHQQAVAAAGRQREIENLPAQFLRQGVKPEAMDNRDVGQPGEQPIQAQQFDMPGYAQAMFRYSPQAALALQASLRKDTTPIKLGAGDTLFDPQTLKPVASNPKAEEQPSSVREYMFARLQGYAGTFDQWDKERRRAGAASTTVALGTPVPITMPDGSQALVQPANRPGEPAQIVRIPGTGEIARPPAKEMPAAMAERYATNAVTLGKIDKAIELVRRNPEALGAQNYLPDAIVQRTDPGGTELRAMIADIGGQKIHDRSGAAVTVGESARLRPYVPAPTDTPQTVAKKLELFRREYAAMQQALASGASIKQAAQGDAGTAAVVDFGSLK